MQEIVYRDGAESDRHLRWDGSFNVRDLGGYPTTDGRRIRRGALIRSDDLCRLTLDGQRSLVAHGVRTVIDLRSGWELEAAHPFRPAANARDDRDAPTYLNLTIRDPDDAELVRALNESRSEIEAYTQLVGRGAASFARIVRAFADARAGGVLVHCAAGKDRTGMLVAVFLALAGVPDDVIVEDYVFTNTLLRPYYEAQMLGHTAGESAEARAARIPTCRPETMRAVLAMLRDSFGGAVPYLKSGGLTDEELSRARARLREPA